MADIFLSYASEDRERVRPLVELMEEQGYSVWWDRQIGIGSSFDREIERELNAARCVVVVWSNDSIQSDWVRNEAQEGLDRGILVPAQIENVKPPLAFRRAQAALLHGSTTAAELDRLLEAIGACVRADSSAAKVVPNDNVPTVAVLPFTNLSDDPDKAHFSEGISEDILDGLACNPALVVRARQSSFLFDSRSADPRNVADRLDVAYLVTGTVRSQGDSVRVTARLTDVAANRDVWSKRYDRELKDIFAVQDEVTESIVSALGLQFSDVARQPVAMDAYHAYLSGRYHQCRYELDEAAKSFVRATELDPAYADAYAALAQIHATWADSSPPDMDRLVAKEREFVARALECDAQQRLALGLQTLNQSPQQAINQLDHLTQRYPNDTDLLTFYSFVLHRVGKLEEELLILNKMVSLDPLSPRPFVFRCLSHVYSGRLPDARDDLKKCELLGMPNPTLGAQIAFLEGDIEELKLQCSRDWLWSHWRIPYKAISAFLEGDTELLTTVLEQLDDEPGTPSFYVRFQLAAIRGESDAAPEYLRSALRSGETYALRLTRGDNLTKALLPDFFGSEEHEAILREFELDDESVAKLSIPLLPI